MANVTSPNMNLLIPGVGTEGGPQYAQDINNDLSILDAHDHSNGSGVQITPSGLNINTALSINAHSLTNVGLLNLTALSSTPSVNQSIYSSGVDLYFLDGSGNPIRLTQGGSIVGTAGSITGLPSGTASASFASGTFVFQSATSTAANIDGGSFVLRNNTALSKGLTLAPPSAMAANYSLVLPLIPAQTNVMVLDTSGNMGSSTYSSVFASGITEANANSVMANVTTVPAAQANLVLGAFTSVSSSQANIVLNSSSNPSIPGSSTNIGGKRAVTANYTTSSAGPGIIWGAVDSAGNPILGDGYTPTRLGTGLYFIAFDTNFGSDNVVITATIGPSGAITVGAKRPLVVNIDRTGATISIVQPESVDCGFSFIAIGVKA